MGDCLLLAAEGLKEAAALLWVHRGRLKGNPLEAATNAAFAKWMPPDLRDYLHHSVTRGVPTRRHTGKWRLKAKPHASAREHIDSIYEGMWDDTLHGVVLWLTETHESHLQDLVEAHQGAVEKCFLGTPTGDIRGISDARAQNKGTRKEDHPPGSPAPPPQHGPHPLLVERPAPGSGPGLREARRQPRVQVARP